MVEDVHWAESATLDSVTFLVRAGLRDVVTVVGACRSDEAPIAAQVTDWLTVVRGGSEGDPAGPVAAAAGGGAGGSLVRPGAAGAVNEVCARNDLLGEHAEILLDLANVLAALGRVNEVHAIAALAVDLYQGKGNPPGFGSRFGDLPAAHHLKGFIHSMKEFALVYERMDS